MKIFYTINEVREQIKSWRKEGFTIGLVPTMGYLHAGHKSLIDKAVKENDKVVVSIFVNPIQFAPNEDLDKYPRDLNKDAALCSDANADLIFNPEPSEMYISNASTFINVEGPSEGLCGAKRPSHFTGVCTVVSKLFNIVTPDKAYFGEKDAQQLAIIKKMVQDLNFNIEIISCPIIREENGIALSSRNKYLSFHEKNAACILNISLKKAKEYLKEGLRDAPTLIKAISEELTKEPLVKIDYVEVVDKLSLKPVKTIEKPVLVAIAAFIGKTRLIDNFTWQK